MKTALQDYEEYDEMLRAHLTSRTWTANPKEAVDTIERLWDEADSRENFEDALVKEAHADPDFASCGAFGEWTKRSWKHWRPLTNEMFDAMRTMDGCLVVGEYESDAGRCIVNIGDAGCVGCPNGYGDGKFRYIIFDAGSEADGRFNEWMCTDSCKAEFGLVEGGEAWVAYYDCDPFGKHGKAIPVDRFEQDFEMFGISGCLFIRRG